MDDEFTIAGFTIPRIAIYDGAFLVLWGIVAYLISGQSSITAMIPSFMGAPLMILGILSERMPNMRHHLMHAAMVLALLMALAPLSMFASMGVPDSSLALFQPCSYLSRSLLHGLWNHVIPRSPYRT